MYINSESTLSPNAAIFFSTMQHRILAHSLSDDTFWFYFSTNNARRYIVAFNLLKFFTVGFTKFGSASWANPIYGSIDAMHFLNSTQFAVVIKSGTSAVTRPTLLPRAFAFTGARFNTLNKLVIALRSKRRFNTLVTCCFSNDISSLIF